MMGYPSRHGWEAVRRPPALTGVIYPDSPVVVFYLEACGTSFCCGASLLCGTDLAMLTFLALGLALRYLSTLQCYFLGSDH